MTDGLRAAGAGRPEAGPETGPQEPAAGTRKAVLVVDDEQSILTYLGTVLEDHGYRARTAPDAASAISQARDEKPALVCMDVMMPKRSGLALYLDIRRDPGLRDVPVIFVSAFTLVKDLRDVGTFRKMVADEQVPLPELCLEKPVSVKEFVAAVASLIGPGRTPERGDGRA